METNFKINVSYNEAGKELENIVEECIISFIENEENKRRDAYQEFSKLVTEEGQGAGSRNKV